VDVTVRRSEIGPCRGNGIVIRGGSGVKIYDNYVHPEAPKVGCCDNGNGVFASWTSKVLIQGNVIAYSETNVEIQSSSEVEVIGNFLLNPTNDRARGQNVQSGNASRAIRVEGNYMLASPDRKKYKYAEVQEDSLNFESTDGIMVKGNYIQGGHSPSGCGIISDHGANNAQYLDNVLVDTGECGIGITSGINHVVDGNRILNSTPVEGGGNTAIAVWHGDPKSPRCGAVRVSNNIASEIKPDGRESGFWNGGGCEPVTLSGNVFDRAARSLLTPVDQRLPPPRVPPKPYGCVALSPFSNQSAWPPCHPSGDRLTKEGRAPRKSK
jgi:hypothetical protein